MASRPHSSALETELMKLKARLSTKLKRQASKLARARRWPMQECLVGEGWQDTMFAPLLVSKRRPDGEYAACTFIVDLGCLGVKVAGAHNQLTRAQYIALKREASVAAGGFESISPECAARIVHVGLFYALELGFAPAPEYFVAAPILAGVDHEADTTFVPRGHNGKPFFVPSPTDDAEEVVRHLRGRLGPDGFTAVEPRT